MTSRIEVDSKRVLVNSVSAVAHRLLGITVLVWLQQYLVRRISAEEYGLYQVVLALLVFVPLVTAVLGSGLARFVTEALALDRPDRVVRITSTSVLAAAASAVLLLAVGFALVWKIEVAIEVPSALVTDARWMLAILTTLAAMRVAALPFGIGLNVMQRFVWLHLIALASEAIRLVMLCALLFGVGTRALWVVVATVPATAFEVAAMVAFSRRLVPALRFDRRAVALEEIRPIVSFGGWALVGRAAMAAKLAAGPILLNRFSSAVAVSSYSLGAMVETRLFSSIVHPMVTTLPALTAMHARDERERLTRSYYRLTRYLAWVFLLLAFPLAIFHRELWSLYLGSAYPSYVAAGSVMVLLLVRMLIVFPQPAVIQVAAARDRVKPAALRVLAVEGATVLLTAYLVAVRGWGAAGPAVAAVAVAAVGSPLLIWTLGLELTGGRFGEWWRASLRPAVLPAAAAVPVWIGCRHWLAPASWPALAVAALSGGVVYAGVLIAFCLQDDDRGDARRVLRALGRFLGVRTARP